MDLIFILELYDNKINHLKLPIIFLNKVIISYFFFKFIKVYIKNKFINILILVKFKKIFLIL